nr:hypothetical protein [uncultured Kingella sp.]
MGDDGDVADVFHGGCFAFLIGLYLFTKIKAAWQRLLGANKEVEIRKPRIIALLLFFRLPLRVAGVRQPENGMGRFLPAQYWLNVTQGGGCFSGYLWFDWIMTAEQSFQMNR